MNSRTKKSFKNSIVGSASQIICTIVNFLVRTVFIYYLGREYLGINGLFSNILYILNFAELGIGNAIVYKLYKPVADNDKKTINAWIKLYQKIYFLIGVFVLIVGLIIIPFLPFIIKETPNISDNLILIYVLYLLETAGTYFFGYKRSIFLVYEQNYVNSLIDLIFSLLKSLCQVIVLVLTKNFILYLVIYILSTILSNVYISIKANKDYPFLKKKTNLKIKRQEIKELFNNIQSLVMYKLGSTILSGTDNIIISMLIGISAVGLYSNYSLIITAVSGVMWTILTGLRGSIGNLNTTKDHKKQEQIYHQTLYLSCFLYGFAGVMLLTLLKPFIILWIGEEYLLSTNTVILLIIILYLRGSAYATDVYRDTLGLFKKGRLSPFISSIINIVLSFILGKYMNLDGVFLATVIAILMTTYWYTPRILYQEIFKTSFFTYFKKYFIFTIPFIVSYIILNIIFKFIPLGNFFLLIIEGVIATLVILFIFILFTFYTDEFKEVKIKVLSLGRK